MSTDRFPPDRPAPISRQETRFVADAELQAALTEARALPPPPPGPSPARIEAAVREAMALVREGQAKILAGEALLRAALRGR